MARPCKQNTTWLLRKLTPAHRTILLAAGKGDLTKGFEAVLDLYAQLHNAGYREGKGLNPSDFIMNENDSQVAG
jgi:hypothetical protein